MGRSFCADSGVGDLYFSAANRSFAWVQHLSANAGGIRCLTGQKGTGQEESHRYGESEHGRSPWMQHCRNRQLKMLTGEEQLLACIVFGSGLGIRSPAGAACKAGKLAHALASLNVLRPRYPSASPPIKSVIFATRFSKHQRCNPSTIFSVATGSQKFAVPTCTAAARASMNSTASSAVVMPPMPITGISTVCAASQTMRSAIGLIAGPLSPAVTFEMRGFRALASIAIPTNVLTSEIASAPAFSADFAIPGMLVTFGESFTISG